MGSAGEDDRNCPPTPDVVSDDRAGGSVQSGDDGWVGSTGDDGGAAGTEEMEIQPSRHGDDDASFPGEPSATDGGKREGGCARLTDGSRDARYAHGCIIPTSCVGSNGCCDGGGTALPSTDASGDDGACLS